MEYEKQQTIDRLIYDIHGAVNDFCILYGNYPDTIYLGKELSDLLLGHLPVTDMNFKLLGMEVIPYDPTVKKFRLDYNQ